MTSEICSLCSTGDDQDSLQLPHREKRGMLQRLSQVLSKAERLGHPSLQNCPYGIKTMIGNSYNQYLELRACAHGAGVSSNGETIQNMMIIEEDHDSL